MDVFLNLPRIATVMNSRAKQVGKNRHTCDILSTPSEIDLESWRRWNLSIRSRECIVLKDSIGAKGTISVTLKSLSFVCSVIEGEIEFDNSEDLVWLLVRRGRCSEDISGNREGFEFRDRRVQDEAGVSSSRSSVARKSNDKFEWSRRLNGRCGSCDPFNRIAVCCSSVSPANPNLEFFVGFASIHSKMKIHRKTRKNNHVGLQREKRKSHSRKSRT